MIERELRALLDQEACRDLVRRYARGLDRRDLTLLTSLFWEDAVFEHADHFKGSAHEFCRHAVEFLGRFERVFHLIGQHIVEIDGDLGVGEAYGLSSHVVGGDAPFHAIVSARILDRYERRDGAWRIAARRTVLQFGLDVDQSPDWARGVLGPMPPASDFGRWAPDDPSYAWFAALGAGRE